MAGNASGNDTDVTSFSADGRVFQVEYACKAVDNGGTAIGIQCVDGVVVAIEKLHASRMIEPASGQRCHAVDRQAGVCVAGHLPDGRDIVNDVREDAADERKNFGVPMRGKALGHRIGSRMHVNTATGWYRPYGVSLLIASFADDGPQLQLADPSGTVLGYYACAVGTGKTVAKTQLETIDFTTITCRQAVDLAVKIINDVHETKHKTWDIEVAWVCDESQHKFQHVPAALVPAKRG
jgi:20S proteasome subunit alpha 7